jgi:nucleoid DNA-binding protein
MADNKLSWTELRRALANRAGVTEKEANLFLNAFNAQLVEALKSDKQVKINGLGIFRLQTVAPRKSVNVASGEEITIGEYNKIAFVPEAGVKELVEKGLQPSAITNKAAEPVDPIQKLGAQAEEIVDLLGELGQGTKEPSAVSNQPAEKPKAKKAKTKAKAEEPKAEIEEPSAVSIQPSEPVVEEPSAVSIQPSEPVVEEPSAVSIQPSEPVVEEPSAVSIQPSEPVVEEPKAEEPKEAPKKQYHFMRDTLICVVILLMLLLVGYFFLRTQISSWIESLMKDEPKVEMVAEPVVEEPEIVIVEEPEEWTYDELLLTENIAEGSRLAWISKKYYGNKVYWPYLYEANKDHIDNPSLITVGTPIRVPKLSAAEKDTTTAQFQQLKAKAYEKVGMLAN